MCVCVCACVRACVYVWGYVAVYIEQTSFYVSIHMQQVSAQAVTCGQSLCRLWLSILIHTHTPPYIPSYRVCDQGGT